MAGGMRIGHWILCGNIGNIYEVMSIGPLGKEGVIRMIDMLCRCYKSLDYLKRMNGNI
jgi:hypothetical protein